MADSIELDENQQGILKALIVLVLVFGFFAIYVVWFGSSGMA